MKTLIASMASCVLAAASYGQEPLAWPQFRGPHGSGVAVGQKPPIEFGPNKNVKWKVSAPSGSSSPIIAGTNLVFTAFEGGKLYTVAYDRATGKETWRAEAPAKRIEPYHKTEGSPAASTPATDGLRIVSYFGTCGLFCYDLNGNELWRYEMPTVATPFDFGTGVSPVLADDMVVLVRDQKKDPKILAVALSTGKLKWEKKRESKSAFCTPVMYDAPGGKQVAAAGYMRMVGYDCKTGEEKWTVLGMPSATCASPIVDDGTLFFAGWSPGEDKNLPPFDDMLKLAGEEKIGYITREGLDKTFMKGFFDNHDFDHDGKLTRAKWEEAHKILSAAKNSAFALRIGGAGDVTKSHVVWRKNKGLPYVPSDIAYQGQYVLVKDGGLVTAYDSKTGKALCRSVQRPKAATTLPPLQPTGASTSRPWLMAQSRLSRREPKSPMWWHAILRSTKELPQHPPSPTTPFTFVPQATSTRSPRRNERPSPVELGRDGQPRQETRI
jgi:outer membrane protein assembly factor BamB